MIRTSLPRLSSCLLVGIFFCGSLTAVAGIMDGHALVGIRGSGSGGGDLPFDQSVASTSSTGDVLSLSGTGSGVANGYQVASAAASVTPNNSASLLHVYSYASSDQGNIYIGGGATAYAAWRDVTYVTGSTRPGAIRLNFGISGMLGGQLFDDVYTGGSGSSLGAFVGQSSNLAYVAANLGAFTPANNVTLSVGHYAYSPNTQVSGFDDPVAYSGGVSHTIFHYDAPYNSSLGGYDWYVLFEAATSAGHARGSAYGLDSMSVQSVTLTDGSSLASAGLTYSFDSGMTLAAAPETGIGVAAVPEPSSVVLGLLGATTLLACAARKRCARSPQFCQNLLAALR